MGRHLVVLAHADQHGRTKTGTIAENYRLALQTRVDEPVDLIFCNAFQYGNRSAAYRQLAAELRGPDGRYLPEILHYAGSPRMLDDYETVTAAAFSAGYALWRDVCACTDDAMALDGIVLIDSGHSGFDTDGTAADLQLAWLVAQARRAQGGPKVCWIKHTDVRTPQPGTPGAFASTTQVADEVRRLAGGCRGGFRIDAVDLEARDHAEHVRALSDWGDEWLADAVAEMLRRRADAGVEPADELADTQPDLPIGERALALARTEQAAGVKEVRGPRHHEHILRYFAGCERGGRNIGAALQADEYAWCAAAFSWCAFQARVRGEELPYKWRAAVRELWLDAMASHAAIAADRVRSGEVEPAVGDGWIGVRGGSAASRGPDPFAATNGKGHVGRIAAWQPTGTFVTLDGNVYDTWTDVTRHVDDAEFVGTVRHPRAGRRPRPPGEAELEVARRLWRLHNDLAAGRGDDLPALLDA